ncbi:MAG: fasciclin domain-containing protein [Rhodothermales bacterium]|nr:fasciclin domain-containing protein [Rhodothermales bacterium]
MLALLYVIFVAALFGTRSLIADDITTNSPQHDDIIDIASSNDNFQTLVAAIKAAGLVETLKGDGPFTVFAPTDEAFAALPDGTVENLLKPENRDQLVQILTFHVVPGKIMSGQLLKLGEAKTVNGSKLPIGLSIGDANVIATDIEASNGVIHVIDRVLVPSAPQMTESGAATIIREAIARGVPLYNNGQPEACAAIYELAAMAVLQLDDNLSPEASKPLADALHKIKRSHNSSDRAWIMREGLDRALAEMSPRKMSVSPDRRY